MRTAKSYLVLAIMAGVLFAAPALADDMNPPPWRGLPRSTMQEWTFSVDNRHPLPDLMNNPYGIPQMTIVPFPEPGWYNQYPIGGLLPRQGVYSLSGQIDITIPNVPDGNWKSIWIQLVWTPDPQYPLAEPAIYVAAPGSQVKHQAVLVETCLGDPWRYTEWEYILQPNPPIEHIRINGNILVDQLVIDTYCPEPATMALLGLGGLALLRRRNRK